MEQPMSVFLARLRGTDRSDALRIEESTIELAALAFVEEAGMIVDLPGKVTIEVRDLELGIEEAFEIDLEPGVRRKAA